MNPFRRQRPQESEVQPPIELDPKNSKFRIISLIVLIVIAVVSLTYGFTELVKVDPGWYFLEVTDGNDSCCYDFVCNYYVNDEQEQKDVTSVYTQACKQAYAIFSPNAAETVTGNLNYVNSHANEPVEVAPALYQALKLMEESGSRLLYLAPVYSEYALLFGLTEEVHAKDYDPMRNPELGAYVDELVVFTNNPEHVQLQLLENNQVQLFVSQEYLDFARENGIDAFVDFGWTVNAFVVDYLAQVMQEAGYTNGYIVSSDGFTRNLCATDDLFGLNVPDWNNGWYVPAIMDYNGPVSIVLLRGRPIDGQSVDTLHYYAYSDGTVTTAFLDPADGKSKCATDSLITYSRTAGCAQILMESAKVFLAEELDGEKLSDMAEQKMYSLWCEGNTLFYNEAGITLKPNENSDATYATELAK